MSRLVIHSPYQIPFSVELVESVHIGRYSDSDVVLTDSKASRRHAIVRRTAEGWEIADLGSKHGTFVNGDRVSSRCLADGDRIQIGEVLLVFEEHSSADEILFRYPTEPGLPHGDALARLRIFYDVAAAIAELSDPDALLGRMLGAILDVLGCERGLAGVLEPEGIRRIARARGAAVPGEIVLARDLLDAIVKRRESVMLREPLAGRDRTTCAMGVPLLAGPRVVGLLYVERQGTERGFLEDDLAFLSALGHLTAAALESADRYRRLAAQNHTGGAMALLAGESEAMSVLRAGIRKYGASSAHVLVHGESGTGKELVARALHALSPRASKPFVTLNSAAIPETMIESELFGHQKGAFTGALKDKRGKFVLAHGGTLFLDEIGDLGAAAQAKLLRAIQEGEVQPVGAEKADRVDVRVISATHKDLSEEVRAGRFREDLFYRLAVVELSVPPLRERGDDVGVLARLFVDAAAQRLQKSVIGFSAEALAVLRAHVWPGNVRELQNECERAVILSDGPYLEADVLSHRVRSGAASMTPSAGVPQQSRRATSVPPPLMSGPTPSPIVLSTPASMSLAERFAQLEPMERALIEDALAAARGNISEAARLLGITRIMMRRRVERFGLAHRDD